MGLALAAAAARLATRTAPGAATGATPAPRGTAAAAPRGRRCYLPDHGFTLTLLVTGTGQGELRNGSTTLISGFTRTFGVDFGDRVTLVATPLAGSGFFGWTGPCAAVGRETTCTFDVDADATIEARFEPILQVDVVPTSPDHRPEFTGGVACAPDVATCAS